jgi:hypothetical protein
VLSELKSRPGRGFRETPAAGWGHQRPYRFMDHGITCARTQASDWGASCGLVGDPRRHALGLKENAVAVA